MKSRSNKDEFWLKFQSMTSNGRSMAEVVGIVTKITSNFLEINQVCRFGICQSSAILVTWC